MKPNSRASRHLSTTNLASAMLLVCLTYILAAQPAPTYAQLRITEVYPAPPAGQFEWVEIQNISSDDIAIGTYKLVDDANHFIKLPILTMPSQSYAIATASGILNNSGDSVTLLSPQGITIDTTTYSITLTSSQSYSICGDEWIVSDVTTPGFENGACLLPTFEATLEPSSTPFPTSKLNISSVTQATKQNTDVPTSLKPSTIQPSPQVFALRHKPFVPSQIPTPLPSPLTSEVLGARTSSSTGTSSSTSSNNPHPTFNASQSIIPVIGVLILAFGFVGYAAYIFIKWRDLRIIKMHEEVTTHDPEEISEELPPP